MIYDNTPTVVVVLVPIGNEVLLVKRGLTDGYGSLALPGGFQERPESVQEAGAREVLEETGVVVDPAKFTLIDLCTTPDGQFNLAFFESEWLDAAPAFSFDAEILDVVLTDRPIDLAFPLHTKVLQRFFDETGPRPLF